MSIKEREGEERSTKTNVSCGAKFVIQFSFLFLSTPPSRTTAFEEFKQERGSEINRILIENKGKHTVKTFIEGEGR